MATIASAAASGLAAPQFDDELDSPALQNRQQGFDASRQPGIVAAGRIATSTKLRQRNRALGQALEHEVVERAMLGKMRRAHRADRPQIPLHRLFATMYA